MLRRIGSGGFARVYRAYDPELELEVALKLLHPEIVSDPDVVERFRREAGTAARLRHPNVVTVLTVGRLDEPFDGAPAGAPFLAMDFLPGSLAQRLAERGTLPEQELARLGAQVASGLAYAHRHDIVHRDIKPENILFAADGRAVVTDFGIARAVTSTSRGATRDVVLGTPSYFSPEQSRGLPLDGRSDIYSLGITLYQAATGALPYTGDDWYAIMRQHVDAPVPSPRERAPWLSAAFDAVVQRCLAKDPADRYESAEELADVLAALAGPEAATVAVPLLAADGRRKPRVAGGPGAVIAGRRWWPLAAVGAVLLAVSTYAVRRVGDGARETRQRLTTGADSLRGTTTGPTAPFDSLPNAPPPSISSLRVSAPPSAELTLDGGRIGRGMWQTDSVAPGRHVLRASIPAIPGCATAQEELAVTLLPGEVRAVQLRPVGCGRLQISDVSPMPANFTVRAERGTAVRSGRLPLAEPLVLPEGDYTLTATAPGCSPFTDEHVKVPGNGGTRRVARIRLICG